MLVFLLSVTAALAALLGGFIAIKSRRKINLALGFTAGIILGLVAFDLLPEIFEISQSQGLDIMWPMITLVSGFLLFHIVEKFILLHHGNESKYGPHTHPYVGIAGAAALIGHSFLDGVSIGIGFQVSTTGGLATLLFSLSESVLAIYLGFFAGFLLYIGASDILPQAHSKSSSRWTIGLTVLGTAFMFLVTRLA